MTRQEIIDYYVNIKNCSLYQFPKDMHPYMKKFCDKHNILVFHVPEDDKFNYREKPFLELSGAEIKLKVVLIRSYKYEAICELEFGIWHEIGHIMMKTNNEQIADVFAIEKLRELYGKDEGTKVYLRWLFKRVKLNKDTHEFNSEPTEEPFDYSHRNIIVNDCIRIGLDKYDDCFK